MGNKKAKAKKIAIHAELRKESQAFDGYLKYEVSVKNPDGSIEKVPAYGKDLQDALSRVVHDEKVVNLEKKIVKKLPEVAWVIAWILGLSLLVVLTTNYIKNEYTGLWFLAIIAGYAIGTLSISNWFKLRNRLK